MATHTVYGCYDKATGVIEFDDTYTGCTSATITGCLVLSGEHKGKIQITHDYDGCETDEYYACYDPDTGKFQYEADDDCCIESVSGDCCGTDCTARPKYLTAVVSGITGTACQLLNGTYILTVKPSSWCRHQAVYYEGIYRHVVTVDMGYALYGSKKLYAYASLYRISSGYQVCLRASYNDNFTSSNCILANCAGLPHTVDFGGSGGSIAIST